MNLLLRNFSLFATLAELRPIWGSQNSLNLAETLDLKQIAQLETFFETKSMNHRPIFLRSLAVLWTLALFGALNLATAQQRTYPGAGEPSSGNSDPFVKMVRHNDGSRTVTARSDLTNEFNPNMDERLMVPIQEVVTYDPEGNMRLRRVYTLNRYGQAETVMMTNGDGTRILRGEFHYDFTGRLQVEKLFTLPGDRLVREQRTDYDSNGRGTKRTINHGAMPPDLLKWMDPDGNVAGVKTDTPSTTRWLRGGNRGNSSANPVNGSGGPAPKKKGLLRRILGKD